MSESDYDLANDCTVSCDCEGVLVMCPNVIAFGASVLDYARMVQAAKMRAEDAPQTD